MKFSEEKQFAVSKIEKMQVREQEQKQKKKSFRQMFKIIFSPVKIITTIDTHRPYMDLVHPTTICMKVAVG